jgi:hypothetical protein
VGITLPQAGQQATRENVVRMAQNAEKEGFDSLWVFERLLWPINPQTPYPGTPDGSLPIESQNVFDPLETLTYVAAHTDRITLGTSVIDMLFHNPVILARRFATLDVLSEGSICGLKTVHIRYTRFNKQFLDSQLGGNPSTVSIGKMLTVMSEQDNTIRVLSRILGRDYNEQHLHDMHNSLFGDIASGPSSGREGMHVGNLLVGQTP